MSRLAICTAVAAGVLLWPCVVAASDPLPADPYAIFSAGRTLVAVSADARLWRRGMDKDAAWQQVPLGEGESAVSSYTCASDDSGICVVTAASAGGPVLDRVDSATGQLTRLPAVDGSVSSMPDSDTIDLIRPQPSGDTAVVRYSISAKTTRTLGVLAKGEQLLALPLGGKLVPVAFSYSGSMRELETGTPIQFNMVENLLWQADSLMVREPWTHEPPAIPGQRAVASIRFDKAAQDGKPVWRASQIIATALPVSGPLFDERDGAMDANGDMLVELVGGGVDKVGVLCKMANNNFGFRGLLDIRPGQTTSISGTLSGDGFVLRTDSLLHTPQFDVLILSPAKGGWRNRRCDDTTFSFYSGNVAAEDNHDLELTSMQAVSADGTKVPYYVLKPRGLTPDHVLIDVYGAYGFRRAFEAYHGPTISLLRDSRTAIAFAVVRGDGDLGYDYAIASRTPYRQRAVDDVVAVAQDVATRFPELKDKPTVRGQSAGAWLAMKASLSRPDLFSGAIGYSGLYLLTNDPLANGGNGYFTADDDLGPVVAAASDACPRLHFRFLHAKDDPKTSYDKAVAFSEQLKAAGCPVEFVGFDGGGHNIDIYPGQELDAQRRLKGYFTPF